MRAHTFDVKPGGQRFSDWMMMSSSHGEKEPSFRPLSVIRVRTFDNMLL